MVCHMKTTLNIPDPVMRELKEEAARRGTTMSALVEAGLRRLLIESRSERRSADELPELPSWNSGGMLVDVSDRDALYDLLDEERDGLYRRTSER